MNVCLDIFTIISPRLINTGPPASDTQNEMTEEEAQKQQTFARLKAVLQFYQESEVRTRQMVLVSMT